MTEEPSRLRAAENLLAAPLTRSDAIILLCGYWIFERIMVAAEAFVRGVLS